MGSGDLQTGFGPYDAEGVLAECCSARSAAVLTFRDAGLPLRASFSRCRGQQLELELTDGRPDSEIPQSSDCFVSFIHRDQALMFSTLLQEIRLDSGPAILTLKMPEHITGDGARSAFRIPVSGGALPVVLVGDDGRSWDAELVNMSLSGMLVRFREEGPTLLPDQVVEVSTQIQDEALRLAGVVRRVDQDGVALHFPDAVHNDRPDSASPARRMVAMLERSWHSRLRR